MTDIVDELARPEAVYLAVREGATEPTLSDWRRWDTEHTVAPEFVDGWVVVATIPYDAHDPDGRTEAYVAANALDGDTTGGVYPSPDPDLPLGAV